MKRNHFHTQLTGGRDGVLNRVWNIVKFEIEENARARFADSSDDRRAGNRAKLEAYFKETHLPTELLGERERACLRGDIERDNDAV
jgi:hypothetical protein